MQKSILWAEDLEGHRQPSLYYLSSEEGGDGPYLICDWNGCPTDFSEMEFDTLKMFQKQAEDQTQAISNEDVSKKVTTDDEYVDYPNPAANLTKMSQNGEIRTPTQRQNDLDFAECAHLDFLSVPPMTANLLKRSVRNLLDAKKKCQLAKVEKMPRRIE